MGWRRGLLRHVAGRWVVHTEDSHPLIGHRVEWFELRALPDPAIAEALQGVVLEHVDGEWWRPARPVFVDGEIVSGLRAKRRPIVNPLTA